MASDRSDRLPAGGVILGAGTAGRLAQAPVLTAVTAAGDLVAAATHHGVGYRGVNEDRIAMAEAAGRDGPRVSLFVIDGMGGREHGDLASQMIAEELIRASLLDEDQTAAEVRGVLARRIALTIEELPGDFLPRRVAARVAAAVADPTIPTSVLVRAATEAIQAETMDLDEASETAIRRVAQVYRTLADLAPADPVEIAVRRTRARIRQLGGVGAPPDACLIGALLHTEPDGRRILDLRQMGDCRLVVVSAEGVVRFQTFGESMIPEPDLQSPALNLAQLMMYSLHRNVVTNSVCSREMSFKRYRRDDIPLELAPGDRVLLYSDGVDDLFAPIELAEMLDRLGPMELVRSLLETSERRMAFVRTELDRVQAALPAHEGMRAYPIVHQRLNEERLAAGAYCEQYPNGSEGRWMKPPKCDNTAICVLEVGGRRAV